VTHLFFVTLEAERVMNCRKSIQLRQKLTAHLPTVDLISYEVIGLGPLELKELVPGTG
jgi:hypothetical protein